MSKKKHWVFVGDDDDRLEYWRDDKGNTRKGHPEGEGTGPTEG